MATTWQQLRDADAVEFLASEERRSRSHLGRSGGLRPGESLLMYLPLCLAPDAHLRYIGALSLAAVLVAVPGALLAPEMDSPAARALAAQAQAADAAALAAKGFDARLFASSEGHARVAEAVLRLELDAAADVRAFGAAARTAVPDAVLRRVVWSPRTHALFASGLPRTVLLLQARGVLRVPLDLVVTGVLPFACAVV